MRNLFFILNPKQFYIPPYILEVHDIYILLHGDDGGTLARVKNNFVYSVPLNISLSYNVDICKFRISNISPLCSLLLIRDALVRFVRVFTPTTGIFGVRSNQ